MSLLQSRRSRFVLAGLAVLLVVVGAVIFASTRSNKATILDAPGRKPETRLAAFQTFDGAYMTFTYSGSYQVNKVTSNAGDLEVYNLKAGTNYDKQMAVSVSPLPGGDLKANSAYGLRKSQPDQYTNRPVVVDGAAAEVWVKADGHEQTVFIPHGNKIALLSFTTAGTVDDLPTEVDNLIKTFHWKA